MRILITGAGGMLGLDVQRAAEGDGHETVALTRAQLDITDADAVSAVVSAARADAVVNCAAWTDVDGAESRAQDATAVNGAGAGNVAAAAAEAGAWIVHVSTDYVFDGSKPSPYVESDPVRPGVGLRSLQARRRAGRRRGGPGGGTPSSAPRGCSEPEARAFPRRSCARPRNGPS